MKSHVIFTTSAHLCVVKTTNIRSCILHRSWKKIINHFAKKNRSLFGPVPSNTKKNFKETSIFFGKKLKYCFKDSYKKHFLLFVVFHTKMRRCYQKTWFYTLKELKMNVRYVLPICLGYWSPIHSYFTFPSTFRALSREMIDLFQRWHFQAMGRLKIGFQNHMSSKSQYCYG